jgi:WD40 repeat protein
MTLNLTIPRRGAATRPCLPARLARIAAMRAPHGNGACCITLALALGMIDACAPARPHPSSKLNWQILDARAVMALALSQDGSTLAAGRMDGKVVILDLADRNRSCSEFINLGDQSVTSLAIAPDNVRLLVTHSDGQAYVYDRRSRTRQSTPKPGASGIAYASLSPDGVHLAAVGRAGDVGVWSLASGTGLLQLSDPMSYPVYAAFTRDDGRLLTLFNGEACIWDAAVAQKCCVPLQPRLSSGAIAWSGQREVAAIGGEGDLVLYDLRTGGDKWSLHQEARCFAPLAISAPDAMLLECGGNPEVRIRDLETGALRYSLPGHGLVTAAIFANGAGRVLVATVGPELTLWDVPATRELWRMSIPPN